MRGNKQEKVLIITMFIVAFLLLLSIIRRFFS